MFDRVVLVSSLLAMAILLVMLNFTNPAGIGPLGILVFFILVYLVMYGLAVLTVKIFHKALKSNRKIGRIGYLYAAVLAYAPIMILLAQSLGSLSWFTFVLVILFEFLGCFLVSKRV